MAKKRRSQRKPRGILCPYCGRRAKLESAAVIYPFRNDLHKRNIWRCAACDAYVGCHEAGKGYGDGTRPLGRLANAELRRARNTAHEHFDPIWKEGQLRRPQAYKLLSEKLGIPVSRTHIAEFDVAMCTKVVQICSSPSWPRPIPLANSITTRLATATPNAGKRWTPEQDADLEFDWFSGVSLTRIAAAFGRSEVAIAMRLALKGLVLPPYSAEALATASIQARVKAAPMSEPLLVAA